MPRLPATVTRPGPGQPIARFAYEYCRHTKGRQWAGDPVVFEPWQRDFWDEAMAVDVNGKRLYNEVLLGLPRKNGKSTQSSVFALYMLGFDDEGPEVYAAAAAKPQAGIVFNQAKTMVRKSPALDSRLGGIFRVRQYHLECPENDGVFRVLSSDAPLQHGLNPSAVSIDEFWAHKDWELYEALTSGGAAREQPLAQIITTAGWDKESPLGQLYERGMAMPSVERRGRLTIGRNPDTGFLMWWYGATEDDDLEDPRVWMDVNPASWITPEFLRRERTKESMRAETFYQLHLNYWIRAVASAFPPGAWKRTEDPSMRCDCVPSCIPGTCLNGFDPGLPLHVGVDVSLRRDSTSVTFAQRQGEHTRTRTRLWVNPYPPRHDLYRMWVTPIEEVKDFLRVLRREFPRPAAEIDRTVMPGPRFRYDPAFFGNEARELAGEGLAMEMFPQHDAHMIPASETLYRLVMSEAPDGTPRLQQDGDRNVAAQVGNAIAHHKGRDRWRFSKPTGSLSRIDAVISNAMAADAAEQDPPELPREPSRVLRSHRAGRRQGAARQLRPGH